MRWLDLISWFSLGAAALVITWFVFNAGGWQLVLKGAYIGGRVLFKFIPIFLIAFFLVGQAQVLMDRYVDFIKSDQAVREQFITWISGERGVLVAWLGGIFAPSTMALYPILSSLWEKERLGLTFTVTLVLSFTLLNLQILPFRFPLLGREITWILFGSALVIPPLIGSAFLLIERFLR